MKPLAISLPRTLAAASWAVYVLLVAAPASLHADDDKDKKDDKHKKVVEHHDIHDPHEIIHKDDVVKHVVVEHRNVEVDHHKVVVVNPHAVVHSKSGQVFHTHPHYKLYFGNGWRGRGYYYGPPNVEFYAEGPDIAFFPTQEDAPPEFLTEGPDEAASIPASAPANDSPAAAVQAALADKGYYSGAVDGNLGPMTSRAIARYQSDNGLRVTGTINEALLHALKID